MSILETLIDGCDEHLMHMISINCETATAAAAAVATIVTAKAVNIPTVTILKNDKNYLGNCSNSTENGKIEKGERFPMTIISSILPIGQKSIFSLAEISMAVAMRIQSTLRHLDESHQNVLSCVINLMIKYW